MPNLTKTTVHILFKDGQEQTKVFTSEDVALAYSKEVAKVETEWKTITVTRIPKLKK